MGLGCVSVCTEPGHGVPEPSGQRLQVLEGKWVSLSLTSQLLPLHLERPGQETRPHPDLGERSRGWRGSIPSAQWAHQSCLWDEAQNGGWRAQAGSWGGWRGMGT